MGSWSTTGTSPGFSRSQTSRERSKLAEGRPRHWAIELDRPSENVGSGNAAELATYVVDEADAETALAILTDPRNHVSAKEER